MRKEKLMALDGLAPTGEMFRLAERDILKKNRIWPGTYQYEIYIKMPGYRWDFKNCILSY